MTTKLKSLEKIKKLFKMPSWQFSRSTENKVQVGGIVYRKKQGHLLILLLQDKKNYWSIPQRLPKKGDSLDQTIEYIIKEDINLSEFKIWQSLGQIDLADGRRSKRKLSYLHLFLIQALGNFENINSENKFKEVAWLPIEEALEKVDYEDIAKMIFLAVAKIKRAQV